tara:strand:+ start:817 stop:1704 length:888 start_codon:yes stop_codon:yes gene_type:complete
MEETLPGKNDGNALRKSAFGRTNLFLETTSAIFREIRCSASSSTRQASASVFHAHRGNNAHEKPVGCVCWHCCHAYEGDGVRLPRIFDPGENLFHVYGWYCTAHCAKAYILEHSTFDRGYQMNIFVRMLRDVYGIEGSVNEAPPRLSLTMFGGPFDIDSFRQQTMICAMVTPPFVSYCMLIEERHPNATIGENTATRQRGTVRGLRRPAATVTDGLHEEHELCAPENEGVYNTFLQERLATTAGVLDTTAALPLSKKQRTTRVTRTSNMPASSSAGGLAKFACASGTPTTGGDGM